MPRLVLRVVFMIDQEGIERGGVDERSEYMVYYKAIDCFKTH